MGLFHSPLHMGVKFVQTLQAPGTSEHHTCATSADGKGVMHVFGPPIYANCVRLGQFPKLGCIPKSGKSSYVNAKDFRPISISSFFVKDAGGAYGHQGQYTERHDIRSSACLQKKQVGRH